MCHNRLSGIGTRVQHHDIVNCIVECAKRLIIPVFHNVGIRITKDITPLSKTIYKSLNGDEATNESNMMDRPRHQKSTMILSRLLRWVDLRLSVAGMKKKGNSSGSERGVIEVSLAWPWKSGRGVRWRTSGCCPMLIIDYEENTSPRVQHNTIHAWLQTTIAFSVDHLTLKNI